MKNLINESYEGRRLLRTYEYVDKEEFLKNLSEELKKDTFFMGEVDNFFEKDLKLQILKSKCASEYDSDTDIKNVDSVHFGSYPQSDVTGEKKEPIEWIVLEKNNNEAILVSKRILDFKPYFDPKENHDYSGAWFDSYLELWLHKEFMFKAFNRYDFDFLKDINIEYQDVNINEEGGSIDYDEFGTTVSNYYYNYDYKTKNKITIMSYDECLKFIKQKSKSNDSNSTECKILIAKPTDYAKNENIKLNKEKSTYTDSEYYLRDLDIDKEEHYFDSDEPKMGKYESGVLANTYINSKGILSANWGNQALGVRPMIKVSLS